MLKIVMWTMIGHDPGVRDTATRLRCGDTPKRLPQDSPFHRSPCNALHEYRIFFHVGRPFIPADEAMETISHQRFLKKEGFTLIEVMAALAVLAIAFVILLGLRNRDLAISEEATAITQATLLAKQKISELMLKDESERETGERQGDFGEHYPDYTWELEVNEVPLSTSLREFVVRVRWGKKSATEHVQFAKYFLLANKTP